MPCMYGVEYLFGKWGVVALRFEQGIDSTLFSCHHKTKSNMVTQRKPHIGQMIKAVFDKSGMSVTELARRIHTTRSNIYFIFERPDIDVMQLMEICKALNHNFFDDIQIIGKMKSTICPRELHINLNLDDLDDEKSKRVANFLSELNEEYVRNTDEKSLQQ